MGFTINQLLQKAVEAHKENQIQKAERLYTSILKAQPKHPDANHNLGVLAVSVGKIEEAVPFLKTALEAKPSIAQFWFSYIDALIKLGKFVEAKALLDQAKSKGASGAVFDNLSKQISVTGETSDNDKIALSNEPDPPQDQMHSLINLFNQGQLQQAFEKSKFLANSFPKSPALLNIQGALLKGLGQLDLSVAVYKKALAIKPDYAEAHYNMGIALAEQGKLEDAIGSYNKALSIKPYYADAYNNIGIALKELGKLDEAIEAFNKALVIKPDFAEAYSNIGVFQKEQGKLDEAIEAFNKALAMKPDFAEAHRHLSSLIKYKDRDRQIVQVYDLLKKPNLNDKDRCHLNYAYAKMKQDLGELKTAFECYVTGGNLRKSLLQYDYIQDQVLFSKIKNTALMLKNTTLDLSVEVVKHTPIFILGMPRSGTTLVEQIVSSHTAVAAAGELGYVSHFGKNLAIGLSTPSLEAIAKFRQRYLEELAKKSNGHVYVTDKMPHNFQFIALICAALPDAKIIHVYRSAEATCWSNFIHYFVSSNLGYSNNLEDTVGFYNLYWDLMNFWSQSYKDRIYNLDYDKLTVDSESEIRRLIKHLALNWEDSCLAPENNERSVFTASNLQVRNKIYQGSSEVWRKYEPFLNDIFTKLKT